jgi:peptidoglycan/LPS O-acetylase OafA/YrhL
MRSRAFLVPLLSAALAISVLFPLRGWTPGGGILGQVFGYPPFWARLLPLYLAGVVFYRFRESIPFRDSWALAAAAVLGIAAWIPYGWTAAFPVMGAYLVLWFAHHPRIRLHHCARFGDFSYGVYLYGFPVEQLVMQRLGHPVSPFYLFAIATPLTLVLAALSWHGVEKRFLRTAKAIGVRPAFGTAEIPVQSAAVSQPLTDAMVR